MIIGIGIDFIEVDRIRQVYARHGDRFVERILTPLEREYVLRHRDPCERLAGRWAAKEAAFKALGTGLSEGIGWKDAEILPDARGKPILVFRGPAAIRSAQLGASAVHVTITHSTTLAMAQVILEKA